MPVGFIFLHSYYVDADQQREVIGSTTYGDHAFAAALGRETLFAVQFHPEKSDWGRFAIVTQLCSLEPALLTSNSHYRNPAMLVIPAIDLKDGQCVRLRQGDMAQTTVFEGHPVDFARQWVKQGARRLHLIRPQRCLCR